MENPSTFAALQFLSQYIRCNPTRGPSSNKCRGARRGLCTTPPPPPLNPTFVLTASTMEDQILFTSEPDDMENPNPRAAHKVTGSSPTEANKGLNSSASTRRLVVCIDGTSNQFSDKVGLISLTRIYRYIHNNSRLLS